jgi:hypothetical protein
MCPWPTSRSPKPLAFIITLLSAAFVALVVLLFDDLVALFASADTST